MKRLPIVLLALVLSCDESRLVPTTYRIDNELLPYVEVFFAEAISRGVEVRKENLILEFGAATDEICGQCYDPKNGGQRTIIILHNASCWQDASTQNREALVFHELGHCLLGRNHRDDKLPNDAPASIMHSQNSGPYSPCIYDLGGDDSCNKTGRRNYYIDELFDPITPIPDWAD